MLPDVLDAGLSVVFCGTAASAASAAAGHYYAGRGNKFWRILHDVGLTPRQLSPPEYALLAHHRIGLTDIVKGQSGADCDIDFGQGSPARVRESIAALQPWFLAFNGKRAAQEFLGCRSVGYGLRPERIGETRLYVLPSTAGLASGFWDEQPWRELASLVRGSSRQQADRADDAR